MAKHTVQIDVEYIGDLHTTVTHGPSGQTFETDAPLDNQGKAEFISPTDLAAAASASCIATIMGIKARQKNIDIKGMKIKAIKEMVNEPYRRIGKITMDVVFPRKLSDADFKLLTNVPRVCPVTRSLSENVELDINYSFAE